MKNIKTYLYIILAVIIIAIINLCIYGFNERSKFERLYIKELTNTKAYQSENNELKNQSFIGKVIKKFHNS